MSEPTPVPDIHDGPLSDLGHESLRLSVVAALDDLTTKTTQMSGALLLVRTAFNFAETMLSAVVPLQQAVTELQTALGTLQQTVTDQAATVAALQQTVADLQTTVTTLQGQATDLETRVSALENPTPTTGGTA